MPDYEIIAMIFMQIYSRLPSEAEVEFAKRHYETVRETRDLLKDMKGELQTSMKE